MSFRFQNYSRDELVQCSAAFLEDARGFARNFSKATTGQWTDYILDWFWGVRRVGVTVDACSAKTPSLGHCARRDSLGEFLVDMAHTTYPGYVDQARPYRSVRYWQEALERPCEVRLVLESEMGKYGNADETFVRVLEDAAKLAALRADAKVMVFASRDGSDRQSIADALERLRAQSRDPAPWLWIDLPWDSNSSGSWDPASKILG